MIDRIVYVGSTVEVTSTFVDNGNNIIPNDPTLYPTYTVKDINHNIVSFGVGTLNNIDNLYHATITIPISAIISSDDSKWIIEWYMLSDTNIKYKQTELFDVVLANFREESLKESSKLTISSLPINMSMPINTQPSNITFEVLDKNNNRIFSRTPELEGIYNDLYIYNITIPANKTQANNNYNCFWHFTIENNQHSFYTKLQSIDPSTMAILSDIRMYLDKVAKPIDLYLGFRDSDLYHYLEQGKSYLNLILQPTNWNYSFYISNPNFQPYLILGAVYFALQAQFLAEADSAFSYSGQAVTLDVDRSGAISEALERVKTMIEDPTSGFAAYKKVFLRSAGQQNFHLGVMAQTLRGNISNSGVSALAVSRAPWL